MAGWSVLQLTEFFSAITRAGDVASAARTAVQRATESTEAEVAAVVCDNAVVASVGLGRDPDPALFTELQASSEATTLPGLGPLHLAMLAMDRDTDARLIVARAEEPFIAEERQMLQGMARVLGLALRSLRTLENERRLRREREQEAEARLKLLQALAWRERLLETLLRVQRAANQHPTLAETLDAITEGARMLLDDVTTALVLRESGDLDRLTVASVSGPDPDRAALLDVGRLALTTNRPVTEGPLSAVPVHIVSSVAGAFVIAGHGGDERRDVLAAFGEQASLALTGASTRAAVHAAHHDPLTRLPARSLFHQRVHRTLSAAPRPGTAALLYLDLDLFKQVNDTLGHAAGDELLRRVADRLNTVVRSSDMAARLGGDEFAILLEPLTDAQEACDIAQRVIDAIATPFDIGGRTVITRASIGIAYNDHGHTADGLIEEADLAMYRAKRSLPGSYREFDPSMGSGPDPCHTRP
jgi:diguanylate cyclase (GGDEF)-like protein